MKGCLFAALLLGVIFSARALPQGDYSITPGGGCFYALRHHAPGRAAKIEVVGSEAAVERAKNQARKGVYTLDIAGPFGWHTEATTFIRVNWDANFGRPKRSLPDGEKR